MDDPENLNLSQPARRSMDLNFGLPVSGSPNFFGEGKKAASCESAPFFEATKIEDH